MRAQAAVSYSPFRALTRVAEVKLAIARPVLERPHISTQLQVVLLQTSSTAPKKFAAVYRALEGGMALERRLREFFEKREPPKTFCPSEVARALSGEEMEDLGFQEWRDAMPAVRELTWELRSRGECEILQKGEVLGDDIGTKDVKGPIRIRRTSGR